MSNTNVCVSPHCRRKIARTKKFQKKTPTLVFSAAIVLIVLTRDEWDYMYLMNMIYKKIESIGNPF